MAKLIFLLVIPQTFAETMFKFGLRLLAYTCPSFPTT